jgi:hypothetical protein
VSLRENWTTLRPCLKMKEEEKKWRKSRRRRRKRRKKMEDP